MFVTIQLKKSIPARQEFRGAGGLQPSRQAPGGVKLCGTGGGLVGCNPPPQFLDTPFGFGKGHSYSLSKGDAQSWCPKERQGCPQAPPKHPPSQSRLKIGVELAEKKNP